MGRTYRKTDDNWESLRREKEKRKEKVAKKHDFLNEPKRQKRDEDDEYDKRGR